MAVFHLFDIWIPALEAGLMHLDEVVRWADVQIASVDEPPFWILELATAKDIDGVKRAAMAVSGKDPRVPIVHRRECDAIYIGCLYLAYKQEQISVFQMLERAGRRADGRSCAPECECPGVPECEWFYSLLNELEEGAPTELERRLLHVRVDEPFMPLVQFVLSKFAECGKLDETVLLPRA